MERLQGGAAHLRSALHRRHNRVTTGTYTRLQGCEIQQQRSHLQQHAGMHTDVVRLKCARGDRLTSRAAAPAAGRTCCPPAAVLAAATASLAAPAQAERQTAPWAAAPPGSVGSLPGQMRQAQQVAAMTELLASLLAQRRGPWRAAVTRAPTGVAEVAAQQAAAMMDCRRDFAASKEAVPAGVASKEAIPAVETRAVVLAATAMRTWRAVAAVTHAAGESQ